MRGNRIYISLQVGRCDLEPRRVLDTNLADSKTLLSPVEFICLGILQRVGWVEREFFQRKRVVIP